MSLAGAAGPTRLSETASIATIGALVSFTTLVVVVATVAEHVVDADADRVRALAQVARAHGGRVLAPAP